MCVCVCKFCKYVLTKRDTRLLSHTMHKTGQKTKSDSKSEVRETREGKRDLLCQLVEGKEKAFYS